MDSIAITSIILTFMDLAPLAETFALLVCVLAGILLQYSFPEYAGNETQDGYYQNPYNCSGDIPMQWKERNWLNPLFEKYTYSPEEGIRIQKGFIKRSYISIPTTHIRIRIDQSVFQRLIGLCDISFFNDYSGQLFGEEILHNVRIKPAQELFNIL